ncbi:type 4a pilus biogenesis protein PilO [Vibrio hippocampi]|uniref:MSHA biogenesis protein MshJ n=1 Tax=Vibrio hippocampi TaxID=654686 RepID=A0ABN8DGX4_9VIBR|nr:type 4a pilus biogenesis protein PilO [Vibrio hippocampi]CAH0526879.1 hypothetical protein VHP8226_02255 [Vibrio hippocampi]
MKQQWQTYRTKFSATSVREKWLISLCGLVVIIASLFIGLLEPEILNKQALDKRLQTTKNANLELEGQLLLLRSQLVKDPNQAVEKEYADLIEQSQALSSQLSGIVDNLISPSQMAGLLEQVLSQTEGLKLVALESLPPEPITGTSIASEYSGYFVHPVKIELVGGYFAIADYLAKLENMPVKYYWRSFDYSVEAYPQARLTLEIYTLGTRKEFIGG